MRNVFKSIFILMIMAVLIGSSCEENQREEKKVYTQEDIIEANKRMLNYESEKIDRYIEKHDLKLDKTETGLCVELIEVTDSIAATTGRYVSVDFKSYLLDGTLISQSSEQELLTFRIDNDDVVSGLHEGVKLLHVGDSARFIIPPHLAYGLSGYESIPPQASLVYEIRLVSLD